jgi:predicted dehydrogenase
MENVRMSKQPNHSGGNRRDFLKTSTAAAALGSLAALVPAAHAAGSDEMKIGLVGCGGRGTGAASQALKTARSDLKTTGPVKLVAVADAFEDRMDLCLNNLQKDRSIAGFVDCPQERRFIGFDAYKQLIDCGVDVVILSTPPGFRPIHLKAAIDAGKHVFMEKPVAVDAPGVRSVLESARKAKEKNLNLSVGLQRRHQFPYMETIKKLQDGMIGDIVTARAYWNGNTPWVRPRKPDQTEMEYQMRNWYFFNWLCGDHIVEQHIHNLDVINWLKNAYPVSAQGMGGREVRKGEDYGEIYDHHAVEFEYADGCRMYSYCRHMEKCWNHVAEYCQGTKGHADISGESIVVKGDAPWKYRGPTSNAYQQEHDDMFAAIRAGSPLNEGEYGALSTMTAILGRMCTYSGQKLKWEDALNSQISLMPKDFSFDATPPTPAVAVPGVTQVI